MTLSDAPSFFPRRERLWPTLAASLAVHAVVVTLAFAHRPAIVVLDQKPIVARLVRLGEKRPEQWLPRKDQAPAPAPEAKAPVPIPGAPVPPARPSPAAKAPTRTPTQPTAAGPAPRRDALASALERVRRDQALASGPRYGDPSGDPEGDADEASEGDRYLALATRALHSNYRLPSTISEQDRMHLKATVVLVVEADGRISSWRFEQRSGNAAFDDALERAIRQTRLPPPPPEVRNAYRTVGLGVRFVP